MRILNFRRLDLVEANLGPSHPGELGRGRGGSSGSTPCALCECPAFERRPEANLLGAGEGSESGQTGETPKPVPSRPSSLLTLACSFPFCR